MFQMGLYWVSRLGWDEDPEGMACMCKIVYGITSSR